MTIREFSDEHGGLRAIVRRHFAYHKPAIPGGSDALPGFVYTRLLDPAKLGLTFRGGEAAFHQGRALAEMEIVPKLILCGLDQRNWDGARFTAEAIKEVTKQAVPFHTSPAITYPHYKDPAQLIDAAKQYGDPFVHMYLAGKSEVAGLWTEPAEVFAQRIHSAVHANYHQGTPILFDLNFEQMVLLHFLDIEEVELENTPCGPDAWCPTMGGGIVYGTDGSVAEFTPALEII